MHITLYVIVIYNGSNGGSIRVFSAFLGVFFALMGGIFTNYLCVLLPPTLPPTLPPEASYLKQLKSMLIEKHNKKSRINATILHY